MEIKIARSETTILRFMRKDSEGNTITARPEDIFFTVKADYRKEEYLIQKRLSDGGIVFDSEDGYYYITLLPEDTDRLPFGRYYCDIKRKEGRDEKYLLKMTEIQLLPVVTHLVNEG